MLDSAEGTGAYLAGDGLRFPLREVPLQLVYLGLYRVVVRVAGFVLRRVYVLQPLEQCGNCLLYTSDAADEL